MPSNPAYIDALAVLVEQTGDNDLAAWWRTLDWSQIKPKETEYQKRKKCRDTLLIQCLDLMPDDKPWTKCSGLATAIRRFEARAWSRCRFTAEVPERFNELECLLLRMFKLGVSIPGTTQTIVAITKKVSLEI